MIHEEINQNIFNNDLFSTIIGQNNVKEELKSALISKRNIIIVGPPGTGKTTLVKNLTKVLGSLTVNNCGFHCLKENPVCPVCKSNPDIKQKEIHSSERFVRIQGSPDLTVEDLIGDIDPIKAMKFGALSVEAFTPGKIFKANNGILFFDEINRCNEKLQNAMLQLLQEKTVTIGSYSFDFEADFIFIATMNPKDTNTEKLSDVFLDRFDLIYMNYPEKLDYETKIVKEKSFNKNNINFSDDLLNMCIKFIRKLRMSKDLEKVPSVRASIGIYERACANAYLRKDLVVNYDDIFRSMTSVLAHRISLKPSLKHELTTQDFISKSFDSFAKQEGITSQTGDLP